MTDFTTKTAMPWFLCTNNSGGVGANSVRPCRLIIAKIREGMEPLPYRYCVAITMLRKAESPNGTSGEGGERPHSFSKTDIRTFFRTNLTQKQKNL